MLRIIQHALEELGYGDKELKTFMDREEPKKTNLLFDIWEVSWNPIKGGPEAIPREDRDQWLHEIHCQLLLVNAEHKAAKSTMEFQKKKVDELQEWISTIEDLERTDTKADADRDFMAEMTAREKERLKDLDQLLLKRWITVSFYRSYGTVHIVDPATLPDYEQRYVCKGETFSTEKWAAFIDIMELEESYNATHTNTHEVHYGIIPHPDDFTNWKRTGHQKQPQWVKTAKRFKSLEEAQAFYEKTKIRLDGLIQTKLMEAI